MNGFDGMYGQFKKICTVFYEVKQPNKCYSESKSWHCQHLLTP